MRDVFEMHINDLGGVDAASAAELSIARRVAVLTTELEKMEAVFAVSDSTPEQLTLYQGAANSLRRMLESLGLQRRPRDVTTTLQEFLAAKAAQPAGESDRPAGVLVARANANPKPPEGR
jgi:hypothetical protein